MAGCVHYGVHGMSMLLQHLLLGAGKKSAQIIGVVCTATGGGGGTWARVDADGEPYTPASGFFDDHPVWGGIEDVTLDSQAMVKIPKFYVKRATLTTGTYSGKEGWWISDQPADGFHLHPAFMSGGAELDQVYVGKYQASSDGTYLKSVSGVAPVVSISLATAQSRAAARNTGGVTGFMLWSIYHLGAIQWLYLVEKATMDSQTATGTGRVSQSTVANVDATDVATATYRGMVGLWGNVQQWIDGIRTTNIKFAIWDDDGNKTWVSTNYYHSAGTSAIYPLTFMSQSGTGFNYADIFAGDTGQTTNSNATVPDYEYYYGASSATFYPVVGGSYSNSTNAGLWFVRCNLASTDTNTFVGARLAKI